MGSVLLDLRDGIARLTLNRPERLNSISADMREALLSPSGASQKRAPGR